MTKVYFGVIALLSLLSCTRQELRAEEGNHTESQKVVISAGVESPVTEGEKAVPDGKTALKDDCSIVWSEGDKISFWRSGGTHYEMALVSGAGTGEARFSGDVLVDPANPYYAIYPYSSSNLKQAPGLHFSLPQTQAYAYHSFGRGANPMYAKYQTLESTPTFANLCGALRLTLTGDATISRIVLTDLAGARLWGDCCLTLNDKAGTDAQTLTIANGGDSVTLECSPAVSLSAQGGECNFHIVLPAGSLASGFKMQVYDGNKLLLEKSSTAPHIIKRGTIKPMKAVEVRGSADVSDLSAVETANCYIVYDAGLYRFKAVKGNSSEEVVPSRVEAIWETFGTSKAPAVGALVSEVGYQDGYVTFTASQTQGNALIAAKDAEGNILWSWHIWKPATKIRSAQYSTMASGGVMDRNLGALTSVEGDPLSNGFIYQWGRKDPLPGPANNTSGNPEMVTNGTESNGGKFKKVAFDAATMSLEYSLRHPAHFIYASGNPVDWTNTRDNNLWSRTSKTKYDPCPPGYRVIDYGYYDKAPYEVKSSGIVIDGKHFYPFNGVRWNSDGSLHGASNIVAIWNAWGYTQSYLSPYLYYYNNQYKSSASINRAYGCAVRCFTTTTPAPERNDKKFFEALPAGTTVNGVSKTGTTYTLSYSDGSTYTLDSAKAGYVTVSQDGYWEINGVKSSYRHVGIDYMHVGGDGFWYKNAVRTSQMAVPVDPTATDNDTVVTSIVEKARRITVNFSDGSSLTFDKKQDFGLFAKKGGKDDLIIYMGLNSSTKWVRYRFYHRNSNGYHEGKYPDNYDNWGLGTPMTATKTGASSFTDNTGEVIFLNGESEAAVQVDDVREPSSKTYTGGVLHGYEHICTEGGKRLITFKIDGQEVSEDAVFAIRSAKKIEIEQRTKIAPAYTVDVFGNAYASITKNWLIENGKVTISVRYDFLKGVKIYQAKFGMFCVKRRLVDKGQGTYVTNLAWKDTTPNAFYDVSDGWVESGSEIFTRDVKATRVEEYGDFGMSFAMQFDADKPNTLKSKGGFNIGTNGNNYNKIYFDICGNYDAASGDSLYSTVHWEIDYISDYKKF